MSLIHLNFDTETLGKYENAVVCTLACVPFAIDGQNTYAELEEHSFYVKFDIKEQIKDYKREVCKDTIEWWAKQDKEVRDQSIKPSPNDISLEDGLDKLTAFIEKSGYDFKNSYCWSRGNYFDFPKIMSLYRITGKQIPINTFMIRDTRTYIDILTGVSDGQYKLRGGDPKDFEKHNALSDTIIDIMRLQDIYQSIVDDEPF